MPEYIVEEIITRKNKYKVTKVSCELDAMVLVSEKGETNKKVTLIYEGDEDIDYDIER